MSTSIHVVDVSQEDSISDAATSIGAWDILVLGAGHVSTPATIASANVKDFWQSFEVRVVLLHRQPPKLSWLVVVRPTLLTCGLQTNVKGTYLSLRAFLPSANPSHATILALTTGTTALPPSMVPGLSAYMASKLAQTKLIEHAAAENPHIFAATVHPGMVETGIFRRSGAKAESLPMDKGAMSQYLLNLQLHP